MHAHWSHGSDPEEVRHVSRYADSACPFCIDTMAKKGTLSQHFVMHVVPPLVMIFALKIVNALINTVHLAGAPWKQLHMYS